MLGGLVAGALLVWLVLRPRAGGDAERAAELRRVLAEELRAAREEQAASARSLREELATTAKAGQVTVLAQLRDSRDAMTLSLKEISAAQQGHLATVDQRLGALTDSSTAQHEQLRDRLAMHMRELQEGNEKKLEQMRATVDEKLHESLEKRLGESFAQVSERLEAVHKGLGEMQSLATGVGDLKRALTNVKVRGVWGEYQLRSILEDILTPDQYVVNFKPKDDSSAVVEFAIRFPGNGNGQPLYVPIDSKFPQEDYHRLTDAAERADPEEMKSATAALIRAVRIAADDICDKYLNPPVTTPFGILFLPTEGLYAEVLRQPGFVQELQAKCHVVIAGPTTLAAILTSYQMGFRTLAIEQRSHEVWRVLGAVKTEFGRFGEVLDRVKKQLNTASVTLDKTGTRTRAMERRLRDVEELPSDLAVQVLALSNGEVEVVEEEGEEA